MQTSNHFMLLNFVWLKLVTTCFNSHLSVSSLKCHTETDNCARRIACVASVSSRGSSRKLGQEQKK